MQERRESGETFTDMLGYLMKEEDNRYLLSDKEIRDQVVTILYSGYETVSTTSMMALKYLHDHPKALEELRVCFYFLRNIKPDFRVYMVLSGSVIDSWFRIAERTFGHKR